MGKKKEKKEQQSKPKKKRGFLGWLMIFFIIFVIILGAATGVVYWKRKMVTEKALAFYAKRLNIVLIQHYQIPADAKTEGKTETQVREEKQDIAQKTFDAMIEAYKNNASDSGWYDSFRKLDAQLKDIFDDQKITPTEFEAFLKEIENTTSKHLAKQDKSLSEN